PRAVRVDRAGPDPARRAQGLRAQARATPALEKPADQRDVLTPLGFRLLRRLADGEIHSGEALASAVGMSRARVSQVLKEADTPGLKLERIRGRGYRLHDPLPFLDRDAIVAALGPAAKAVKVEVVDT